MSAPDSERPLGESWFGKRAVTAAASAEDSLASLPPPVPEGRVGWALAFGLVSGAAGGAAMIFVASELTRRLVPSSPDVVGTIGGATRVLGGDPFTVAIALGAGIGGIVGLLMGLLMRHAMRMIARLLVGILLAPVLWTLVHAFVLTSYVPSLGALPFGPMVAGAAAYGLCVGLLRPPRRRPPVLADDDA